jgi:hypothetical protein
MGIIGEFVVVYAAILAAELTIRVCAEGWSRYRRRIR